MTQLREFGLVWHVWLKSSINVTLCSSCSSMRLRGTNFVLIFLQIFKRIPISHLLLNVNLILCGSFDSLWPPTHKFLQQVPDFEQLTASHTPMNIFKGLMSLSGYSSHSKTRIWDTASLAQSFKHFVYFCNCCPKLKTKSGVHLMLCDNNAQDRKCTYNATMMRVPITTVAMQKQGVLHILSVCLYSLLSSIKIPCVILHCHLWPVLFYHTHNLINCKISGKQFIEHKTCFDFLYNFCAKQHFSFWEEFREFLS